VLSVLRRRSPALVRIRAEVSAIASAPDELGVAARELMRCKLALAECVSRRPLLRSCAQCARGMDGKAGCFSGGLCCSGATEVVFTSEEIAALGLAGASPRDYRASGEDAGCVFRGERGCILSTEHRPSVCVHYLCRDLVAELAEHGAVTDIVAAQDALVAAMQRFQVIFRSWRADAEFASAFAAPLRDAARDHDESRKSHRSASTSRDRE